MGVLRLIGSLGLAIALSGGLCGCGADASGGSSRGGSRGGAASDPNDPFGNTSSDTASGFDNTGAAGSTGAASTVDRSGVGCASANVRASRVKPTVYFVVDGSGSMSENFGGPSRWEALRSALMDPDGLIPTLEGVVEFGMVIYDGPLDPLAAVGAGLDAIIPGLGAVIPTAGAMECPRLVTADAALNNFATIDSLYPQMPLGGSTPTHKALQWANDNLADEMAVQLDTELGPQYVILATDGAPNDFCDGGAGGDASPQVIEAANVGAAKGVKMFVISLASDASLQAHLDQVAQIGNTGQPPFTPSSKDDLVNVLTEIVGGAVGCDVALNGEIQAGQECSGFVEVNGVPLGCNDPNGWQLKNERTIELVGSACQDFQANVDAMLYADFPCGVFAPE
ncbi:MAG: VWA domain-containing protein [Myxococcales bacterium]|nr:VWA domain-containing protein [Myxococcales bacterium]